MTFYIVRRIGIGLVVVMIMSIIFFALTRATPGLPFGADVPPPSDAQVARRLHSMGLDKPWYEQYPAYLNRVLHGDLGNSFVYRKPIGVLLGERAPNSVLLLGASLVVSLLIAIPLGMFAATHQYSKVDMLTSAISYVGISIPGFVLGIFLLVAGGVGLRHLTAGWLYFPLFGMHSTDNTGLGDLIWHMALPVTALSVVTTARFSRFIRASTLEVLGQDFVRTARAKGLDERTVEYKHILRSAILPLITLVALQMPQFVSGAVIIEGIFSWPGMGLMVVQAASARDYPLILGVALLVGVLTVFFNLLADVALAVVDPRIRY